MTPEHFDLWLLNPTTIEFMDAVKARLHDERVKLAAGWHLKNNPHETNQSYAKAVGRTGVLSELLDVKKFVESNEDIKA